MTAQLPELSILEPMGKHLQRLMLSHLTRRGHPFTELFLGHRAGDRNFR